MGSRMAERKTVQEEEIKECAHCARLSNPGEPFPRTYGNDYCPRCYQAILRLMLHEIILPLKPQLWDLAERWLWEKENDGQANKD